MSDDRGYRRDLDEDELLDESGLDPSLAMPSPRVYRGSLIALLLGSIFAVWLLVLPPVGADQDGPPSSTGIIATATAEATATQQPGAVVTTTPSAESTSTATPEATVEATATAEPTAAPTAQVVTYTIVSGDNMLSIAQRFLPAGRELNEFAEAIAAANGIFDITSIQVGQVLTIPDQ